MTAVGSDRLPVAGSIAVRIGVAGAIVRHLDSLDTHAEGSLRVIGRTSSPLDRALRIARVATRPSAELNLHRRLGVLIRLGF